MFFVGTRMPSRPTVGLHRFVDFESSTPQSASATYGLVRVRCGCRFRRRAARQRCLVPRLVWLRYVDLSESLFGVAVVVAAL